MCEEKRMDGSDGSDLSDAGAVPWNGNADYGLQADMQYWKEREQRRMHEATENELKATALVSALLPCWSIYRSFPSIIQPRMCLTDMECLNVSKQFPMSYKDIRKFFPRPINL